MSRLWEVTPDEEVTEGGDVHEGLSNIRGPGGKNVDDDDDDED
jgi:hypothetical protein